MYASIRFLVLFRVIGGPEVIPESMGANQGWGANPSQSTVTHHSLTHMHQYEDILMNKTNKKSWPKGNIYYCIHICLTKAKHGKNAATEMALVSIIFTLHVLQNPSTAMLIFWHTSKQRKRPDFGHNSVLIKYKIVLPLYGRTVYNSYTLFLH